MVLSHTNMLQIGGADAVGLQQRNTNLEETATAALQHNKRLIPDHWGKRVRSNLAARNLDRASASIGAMLDKR